MGEDESRIKVQHRWILGSVCRDKLLPKSKAITENGDDAQQFATWHIVKLAHMKFKFKNEINRVIESTRARPFDSVRRRFVNAVMRGLNKEQQPNLISVITRQTRFDSC